MKKVLLILLCIVVLLGSGGLYFKIQMNRALNNPLKIKEETVIDVKQGEGLYTILDELDNHDKIVNSYLIRYYITKNNIKIDIKQGKHIIMPDMSLREFIEKLNEPVLLDDDIQVTIKEGNSISQIAKILDDKGIIDKNKFLECVSNYELPQYIKKDDNRRYALEGFLFPDTYRFKVNTNGNSIIKTMLSRFNDIINDIYGEENINYENLDDIITIASIIEKEVQISEERVKVSSVIYNRLKKDMLIQCDPTVLYALGVHKDKVLYKDLEVDSPYNTYKYKGLPVGPICNPGEASIFAALHPANTNYLYFVSYNDGTHFFTDNYQEFLKVANETQGN